MTKYLSPVFFSKSFLVFFLLFSLPIRAVFGENPRFIHVFVALCDNTHQGIVPVPELLGNGDDPENNLYWGALYGIKTHFRNSPDWQLIKTIANPLPEILERCIFKSALTKTYLVADAYKGSRIKETVTDFLETSAGIYQDSSIMNLEDDSIYIKGGKDASLIAYVGHNGLMDFSLESIPEGKGNKSRDVIILACSSKTFFAIPLQTAGAFPLLWTTGLMAPEAYTLKEAIKGWLLGESGEKIRDRAASVYSKYQNCSLKAAKNLFVTGWE